MSLAAQISAKTLARWSAAVDVALQETLRLTDEATPVDTGFLQHSNRVERRDQSTTVLGGVIQNTAKYAGWVDDGTVGGQLIEPKQGLALRFVVGGETVFARRVIRGSTPAAHFFKEPMPERWRAGIRAGLAATA